MPKLLDRRTMLRGAGGAAAALPVLEAMLPLVGRARAATAAPRRLVIVYSPNGHNMDTWKYPVSATDPTSFTFSAGVKPLEPLKERCLFLEGVGNYSGADRRTFAQGHPGGCTSMLTGSWAGPGTYYNGGKDNPGAGTPYHESLDDFIAKRVGSATKFPAYYLSAFASETALYSRPFYTRRAGQERAEMIPLKADPYAVHKELFTDLVAPGGAPDPAVEAKRSLRRSIVDAVMGDYRSLRCKLGAADRARLEQHVAGLADLEARLAQAPKPPAVGAGCKTPPIDAANRIETNRFANVSRTVRMQLDYVAAMLACDLTRVVGFQFWKSDGDCRIVPTFVEGQTQCHHDTSHLMGGGDARLRMTQLDAYFAGEIRYLAERLKALPEGDGTVFDNTVILWVSEWGNGWEHEGSFRNMAHALIGHGGGYFKTGRYLKYAQTSTNAHNRLFVSLAQYMGVDTSTFGAPEYCQGGALPGLTT
mgnify:CR=1 FL=1